MPRSRLSKNLHSETPRIILPSAMRSKLSRLKAKIKSKKPVISTRNPSKVEQQIWSHNSELIFSEERLFFNRPKSSRPKPPTYRPGFSIHIASNPPNGTSFFHTSRQVKDPFLVVNYGPMLPLSSTPHPLVPPLLLYLVDRESAEDSLPPLLIRPCERFIELTCRLKEIDNEDSRSHDEDETFGRIETYWPLAAAASMRYLKKRKATQEEIQKFGSYLFQLLQEVI